MKVEQKDIRTNGHKEYLIEVWVGVWEEGLQMEVQKRYFTNWTKS